MVGIATIIFSCCIIAVIFGGCTKKRSFFHKRSLIEQEAGLKYKKIEGKRTSIECTTLCSDYNGCRSFYVDDGACVFGLRDDVTEFANGDDVTPADGQMLMTKRMY